MENSYASRNKGDGEVTFQMLCPLDANPKLMTNVAQAMSCPYNSMEETNDD